MEKVLITGGSGFIARYFIDRLKHREVVNLDIKAPEFQSHAKYIQGDIRHAASVEMAMKGTDTLIHLAAMHHDFGISDEAYFDTNTHGAKTLIAEAEKQSVSTIIFYSTVAVYGAAGNPGPTTEQTPAQPSGAYGKSKLEAENLFIKWANNKEGRKLIIVRATVVFGPYNLANVLNLIKVIDQGLYVHVGSGKNKKSIAYVENIVDASLFALEHASSPVFLFNYSDSPHLSSHAIAQMQAQMLGKSIRLKVPLCLAVIGAFPFDLMIWLTKKNLIISSARVKKLCIQTLHQTDAINKLGFLPKHSIESGMQAMISWYQSSKKKM